MNESQRKILKVHREKNNRELYYSCWSNYSENLFSKDFFIFLYVNVYIKQQNLVIHHKSSLPVISTILINKRNPHKRMRSTAMCEVIIYLAVTGNLKILWDFFANYIFFQNPNYSQDSRVDNVINRNKSPREAYAVNKNNGIDDSLSKLYYVCQGFIMAYW